MITSIRISDAWTSVVKGQMALPRSLFSLAMVALLGLLWSQTALAVAYIDKDRPAGGNGTSWAQAFNSIDAALDAYPNSAEVFWIAEGTYFPSAPYILGDGHNHSFYGGFAGTESLLSQRNVAAHPVIIDGQGTLAHIFNVTSWVNSVRFDGLTFQGGAALGAVDGESGMGGAIIINMLSSAVIANCTFRNNRANGLGGAVVVFNTASMVITGSTFIDNTSIQDGGGAVSLYWDKTGTQPAATISKCTFRGNQASRDGGAVYEGQYKLALKDSTFIDNTSDLEAGAVKLDFINGGTKIERCLFLGNNVTSSSGGGAIQSYEQSFVVENSVFAFNAALSSAAGGGGALFLNAGSNAAYSVTVTNSTFYGNRTDGWGGAICSAAVPVLNLYNSILWGNSAVNFLVAGEPTNDLAILSGGSVTTRYSDIETLDWHHGNPAGESHTGSFIAAPQFVDPDGTDNVPGTADDNLSIQETSPCTDRADGTYAPATDIVLRTRVDNGSVANLGTGSPDYADVGAYEGPYTPTTPPPPPPPPPPKIKSLVPVLHLLLRHKISIPSPPIIIFP